MQNDLAEHLLQGAGPQIAGVKQMVRRFLQGLQAAALLPDGFFQRKALAAQGMLPAGLLVTVDEYLVAGLEKQRVDVETHQPGLVDHAGHGLGVEKLAGAHVRRDGDHGLVQIGVLTGLHKGHQHHGRQVIHTQRAKVFQITDGDGLARAAHPGQDQVLHTFCTSFVLTGLYRRETGASSPRMRTSGSSHTPLSSCTAFCTAATRAR